MITRGVDIPAKGRGYCPEALSPLRYKEIDCNMFACGLAPHCASTVDVIILLDGSGSLGQTGWDQSKETAKKLVEAYSGGGGDVHLGVLLFSGPQYYSLVGPCMTGQADMQNDCKMTWVQHLTGNLSGTTSLLDDMQWPQGSTFTSQALGLADSELLAYGRQNASKVIISITDGMPYSTRATTQESFRVRSDAARLVWVIVNDNGLTAMASVWASMPTRDNVIAVDGFDSLASQDNINNIVVRTCEEVN